MVEDFGTIEEGTGPGMVVGRRGVNKVGAIEEGRGPVKMGLAGLAGTEGEMEMTEDGMMPVKVRAGGAVCVDAAIDEGSGPLAEVGGRANSARKQQLSARASARIGATSAPSSVKSSTSSYSSV